MDIKDIRGRITLIQTSLEAMLPAWPFLLAEIQRMEDDQMESLIRQESQECRGHIKALRAIKELPETLQAERQGLIEGLADE